MATLRAKPCGAVHQLADIFVLLLFHCDKHFGWSAAGLPFQAAGRLEGTSGALSGGGSLHDRHPPTRASIRAVKGAAVRSAQRPAAPARSAGLTY